MTASPSDRIVTLDLIRGLAVMGIFSVNVIAFAMIESAYFNPASQGGASGANLALWAANMLLVDGKMRSLFSMLFGASMLLVVERAEAAGRSGWWTHARRMVVLLGFGLVHYYAIWFGDILTLYALSGLIAFAFRKIAPHRMVVAGAMMLLAHMLMFALFVAAQVHADVAAHAPHASRVAIAAWNDGIGSLYPAPAAIARDRALHLVSWPDFVAHSLGHWQSVFANTLPFMPDTVGLMLIGMAAFRSGFLTGGWSDVAYRRIAVAGIALGLAGGAGVVAADLASHFYAPVILAAFVVADTPFITAQALGVAALVVLWSRRGGWLAGRVAATGRAAFTNYLGTSLIAAFVFNGWGLGLYGQTQRWQAWLLAPLVWALMLAWSAPWLERFHYGPLEWAWRSLARARLQPMRRRARAAMAPAGA